MTKIGDLYKLKIDKDGKVKVERDEAKVKSRKPVCARYANKNKTRVVSRGKALSNAR
jgi:hypothetical protein